MCQLWSRYPDDMLPKVPWWWSSTQLAGTTAGQINWPITLLMRHAKCNQSHARCNLKVKPDVKTRSLRLLNYNSSSECKWSYGNLNGRLISAVKTDELLTAAAVKNLLEHVWRSGHRDCIVTVGDTVRPESRFLTEGRSSYKKHYICCHCRVQSQH